MGRARMPFGEAVATILLAGGVGCEGRALVGLGLEPVVLAAHTGQGGDPATGWGLSISMASEVPGAVGGYAPMDFRMSWLETDDGTPATLATLVVWQRPQDLSPTSYLTFEFGFTVHGTQHSPTAYGVTGGVRWYPYFRRFGYAGRGSFAAVLRASAWGGTDMHDITFGGDVSAGLWLAWGDVPYAPH